MVQNKLKLGTMMILLALVLVWPAAVAAEVEEPAGQTMGTRFSDAWLSARVETAYLFEPQVDTFDLDVEVEDGIVYVFGYVPTELEKERALEIARHTRGVKGVVDMLNVGPRYRATPEREGGFGQFVGDFWTSRRIKASLIASPRVRGTWVGVRANGGVVTLRGSVDELREKEAAEDIAKGVSGVKEVKNDIMVIGS